MPIAILIGMGGAGCAEHAGPSDNVDLNAFPFAPVRGTPQPLSNEDAVLLAESVIADNEALVSVERIKLYGLGETVVVASANAGSNSTVYVVGSDGIPMADYAGLRAINRDLYFSQFGRMSVSLFESQLELSPEETMDVSILVSGDYSEPELPTGATISTATVNDYRNWVRANRATQRERIASAKASLLAYLYSHDAVVLVDDLGLPIVRARLTVALLRSSELNSRDDIVEIQEIVNDEPALLGYAGFGSMNDGALAGGGCGSMKCAGSNMLIGLWESEGGSTFGGIATTNSRIGNSADYLNPPTACHHHSDCVGTLANQQKCTVDADDQLGICLAEHVTGAAASLGMNGTYQYKTENDDCITPIDGTGANAPSNITFPSSGVYNVDFAHANDETVTGLNWLLDTELVTYANRSQAALSNQKSQAVNWAVRNDGLFFTQAGGNAGAGTAKNECQNLWNGLCVGFYRYETFNTMSSHRWSATSDWENDTGDTPILERPHLLGPGTHNDGPDGLHFPALTKPPNCSSGPMVTKDLNGGQIFGSSFSAPAILGVALQAHEYEGWFSALAIPIVLKSVLLASTVDANADGAIGSGNQWSSTTDFHDGAGQIDMNVLKTTLDSNRYLFRDLHDTDFISCGTNCREYVLTTVSVPPNKALKAALVWNACSTTESSDPFLNNNLDLAVKLPGVCFNLTQLSTAINSETEMIYNNCMANKAGNASFTIKVRIAGGGMLNSCNGSAVERVALSWSIQ